MKPTELLLTYHNLNLIYLLKNITRGLLAHTQDN